jgi:citrate synthase
MSAGLMVETADIQAQLGGRLSELGPAAEQVLFTFALAPILLSTALFPDLQDPAASFRRDCDYLGAVHAAVSRDDLSGARRRMFDAVMVSFHGGFGVLPPTVQIPRSSIGTGAPFPHAVAAGYATAGPNHAGACEKAMILFQRAVTNGIAPERAEALVDSEIAAGRVVYGFGHPLFEVDPRPAVLRKMAVDLGLDSPYLTAYDEIRRVMYERLQIHPNIDAISGAIYLAVGIPPAGGTGLFLCSRTLRWPRTRSNDRRQNRRSG